MGIYSKNKGEKEAAQRQARNSPLQGGAADIIYVAMIKLYKRLLPYGDNAKMILQIHDSLILEIKDEYVEEVSKILKDVMENSLKLLCKLTVEMEFGKCLGNMKDFSEFHV